MRKRVTKRQQPCMPGEWQLQDAKAQFSELFRRARAEGPQIVTRQGKESVVVLPMETFESLTARTKQPEDLVEFFAQSPLAKVHLDLERTADDVQDIDLFNPWSDAPQK